MTDVAFNNHLANIMKIMFREDFEAALYDFYVLVSTEQRVKIRNAVASGLMVPPKPWKNPADYDRSDLTPEQRLMQRLLAMSLVEGYYDYREEILELAYCYNQLRSLGINADRVLEEIAEISGPKFRESVLRFLKRAPA